MAASAGPATATVPLTITVTDVVDAPPAPRMLAIGTVTATSILVGWEALTGASAYRVESRIDGPGTTEAWTVTDALPGTTHTLADLTCATTYAVRVRAYGDGMTHAAVWGTAFAEQTVATAACPLPAPAAPANLTAGTVAETSIPVTWDAVAHAVTYRVETQVSGSDAWTTDDDTLTTTAHTVDELTCGTAYDLRVSAFGDGTTRGGRVGYRGQRHPRGHHGRLCAAGARRADDPGRRDHRRDQRPVDLGRGGARGDVPGRIPGGRRRRLDDGRRHADGGGVYAGRADLALRPTRCG